MKVINGYNIVVSDVDSTLVCWNLSKYPKKGRITVDKFGHKTELYPNQKNINLIKKFAKLGYRVIIWSVSGVIWADTIAKALKLEPYVYAVMTKPKYYIDDKKADLWMENIYREVELPKRKRAKK